MPIDYSKYPPNWKAMRTEVLARAANKCEKCGLKNHQIVWSVALHIRKFYKNRNIYTKRSLWFSSEKDAIREAERVKDIKAVRVVLTIAHLDHDETNHDVKTGRLRALCQICHLRYDAKEKFRRINSRKANKKEVL